MSDELANTYARLRASTCAMLGFDAATLSAVQDVRVSMVAGLRLELDRLERFSCAARRLIRGCWCS